MAISFPYQRKSRRKAICILGVMTTRIMFASGLCITVFLLTFAYIRRSINVHLRNANFISITTFGDLRDKPRSLAVTSDSALFLQWAKSKGFKFYLLRKVVVDGFIRNQSYQLIREGFLSMAIAEENSTALVQEVCHDTHEFPY